MRRHDIRTILGFSLLEMLVALGIFAVIAVVAHSGLRMVLNVRAQTEQQAQRLAQLQNAFLYLARDIEQGVNRPIRDEYGDNQPSLKGSETQLEFTRAGWRNPSQQSRSTLQRVAYRVENQTLWRMHWRVLDRAPDSIPTQITLLREVNEIHIRFLDGALQWHETWPPLDFPNAVSVNPGQAIPHLRAVEVSLNVAQWGNLIRLFQVIDERAEDL
jgi:general secretion pathway protein J